MVLIVRFHCNLNLYCPVKRGAHNLKVQIWEVWLYRVISTWIFYQAVTDCILGHCSNIRVKNIGKYSPNQHQTWCRPDIFLAVYPAWIWILMIDMVTMAIKYAILIGWAAYHWWWYSATYQWWYTIQWYQWWYWWWYLVWYGSANRRSRYIHIHTCYIHNTYKSIRWQNLEDINIQNSIDTSTSLQSW